MTAVVTEEVLFAEFGSAVVLLTETVSVTELCSFSVRTAVPVTVAPLATVPRFQVFADELLPCENVKEVSVAPAGTVSVTVTAWASLGPLFDTVIV